MNEAPKKRVAKKSGSPRSAARLAAVQALYQIEMTGISAAKAASEFVQYRIGQPVDGDDNGGDGDYIRADEAMFRELVLGTTGRLADIDPLIADALSTEWPLDRIEMILRAILRAACFELLASIEVPVRVVINEYVDVAHAFFAGKEPGMANGVLDKIGRRVRSTEWENDGRA